MTASREIVRTSLSLAVVAGGLLAACDGTRAPAKERIASGATGDTATLPSGGAMPDFAAVTWTAAREFLSLSSVHEMPDGTVLVADEAGVALVLMDATGRDGGVIGRKGQGPGEYEMPHRLARHAGDSVLLTDIGGRRFVVLGPTGAIGRTFAAPDDDASGLMDTQGDRRGTMTYRMDVFTPDGNTGKFAVLKQWRVGTASFDSIGVLLAATTSSETEKGEAGQPSMTMVFPVPFTPQDDYAVAPDGAVAVVRADPFHVEWIFTNGARAAGPTVETARIRVAAEERTENRGMTLPDFKPSFAAEHSFADPFGRVWVRHHVPYGDATRRWSVFDRRGTRVHDLELPATLRLLHAGRRGVYAAAHDADGIPSLQLFAWRDGGAGMR